MVRRWQVLYYQEQLLQHQLYLQMKLYRTIAVTIHGGFINESAGQQLSQQLQQKQTTEVTTVESTIITAESTGSN